GGTGGVRFATHFVQRTESIEAIQRCVLDTFGGDRCRDLLEFHCEVTQLTPQGFCRYRQLHQQRSADEVECRAFAGSAAATRGDDCPVDVAPVGIRHAVADVG